jgi:hypothetical protein
VSQSAVERLTRYIAAQEEHHRRMTSQAEFALLLHKHHIQYDEQTPSPRLRRGPRSVAAPRLRIQGLPPLRDCGWNEVCDPHSHGSAVGYDLSPLRG